MSDYPLFQLGDIADVVAGDPAPQDRSAFAHDGPLFVRMQGEVEHRDPLEILEELRGIETEILGEIGELVATVRGG